MSTTQTVPGTGLGVVDRQHIMDDHPGVIRQNAERGHSSQPREASRWNAVRNGVQATCSHHRCPPIEVVVSSACTTAAVHNRRSITRQGGSTATLVRATAEQARPVEGVKPGTTSAISVTAR